MTTLTSFLKPYVLPSSLLYADRTIVLFIKTWFAFAMLGQLFFATYILFRYGIPLYKGTPEEVNIGPNITGFIEGDFSGNSMLFIHVMGASLLSVCGMLQLFPQIRQKYPLFHRLNGRLFLIMGLAGALSGLYLTWLRGTRLDDIGAMGITLNGILIPIAIYYAWRYAIVGNINLHRRWAVHAFFLVNAVWTLRLFMMGWFLITQGGLGNTKNMDGPADIILSYACYLLPMLLAELYFWSERQSTASKKWLAAVGMGCGCVITIIGVSAAIYLMWLPRIGGVISNL